MASDRVLIVGGGLAGLCCAKELSHKGIPFTLFEASDGWGGRVRTDEFEGFLLDRGFQVYLTAYPEGLRTLDYAALDFRAFKPGAMVRLAGAFQKLTDPWRVRGETLSTLTSPVGSFRDKLRLRALRSRLLRTPDEEILAAENHTTMWLLKDCGFSPRMIDRFFRPLMGGVMLDSSLLPSSRMFEFVFKMMADGDTAVPAKGMGEIPKQLASKLPSDSLRLNARVASIGDRSVTLESGETVPGAAVVLACEGPEAQRLAPAHLPPQRFRSVACVYYTAPEPPIEGPWLVLNGNNQWPINNLAVMSEVSRDYAPDGRALLSMSVLGKPSQTDDEVQRGVNSQLMRWFGKDAKNWRHLRTYRISYAQPDTVPEPLDRVSPRLAPGLYVAGDHRHMPSIHFAMLSGRLAAESAIGDLTGVSATA
ncbi:MAG: NAD(P)/FAD-dependent oxidoreductase [Bryobacteraceae bacterium]|nr:NAD(P)/FAD-dependent oxidoreductase [Bryobacteraceae bacterium]